MSIFFVAPARQNPVKRQNWKRCCRRTDCGGTLTGEADARTSLQGSLAAVILDIRAIGDPWFAAAVGWSGDASENSTAEEGSSDWFEAQPPLAPPTAAFALQRTTRAAPPTQNEEVAKLQAPLDTALDAVFADWPGG